MSSNTEYEKLKSEEQTTEYRQMIQKHKNEIQKNAFVMRGHTYPILTAKDLINKAGSKFQCTICLNNSVITPCHESFAKFKKCSISKQTENSAACSALFMDYMNCMRTFLTESEYPDYYSLRNYMIGAQDLKETMELYLWQKRYKTIENYLEKHGETMANYQ